MPSARRRQRSQILALLDRYEPLLAAAFRASIDDIRGNVDMAALEAALRAGNTEAAFRALRLDRAAFLQLETGIQAAYGASGTATASSISNIRVPGGRQLFIRFDIRNIRAEAWVREHSSTLITNIIADQRAAVRTVLDAALQRGISPRTVALDIVGRINRATGRREGGIVGLTAKQAEWVENARNELLSGEPSLLRRYLERERRDKRFDAMVHRALRDGTPVDPARVGAAIGRYEDRLLQLRGETIGRTESMAALHAAQNEGFDQAIDNGEVQRQHVKDIWRSAGDSRVRHSHMEMDGQIVMHGEPFVTPDGYRMRFPGDTSLGAPPSEIIGCRCWIETVIDFLAMAA